MGVAVMAKNCCQPVFSAGFEILTYSMPILAAAAHAREIERLPLRLV
jgi:hypothetical protein